MFCNLSVLLVSSRLPRTSDQSGIIRYIWTPAVITQEDRRTHNYLYPSSFNSSSPREDSASLLIQALNLVGIEVNFTLPRNKTSSTERSCTELSTVDGFLSIKNMFWPTVGISLLFIQFCNKYMFPWSQASTRTRSSHPTHDKYN
ncbi:unnamed protein product [Ectocarpus fasciculatus]